MFFDNCHVPASAMVGQRGEGLRQILTTLSIGRMRIGPSG